VISRLGRMLTGSLLVLSWLQVGAAAESGKTWMMYGGDAANTRFSPLSQINRSNVAKLKVAWVAQLGSLEAQESTPLESLIESFIELMSQVFMLPIFHRRTSC
jgi:hypothetical protein